MNEKGASVSVKRMIIKLGDRLAGRQTGWTIYDQSFFTQLDGNYRMFPKTAVV